MEESRTAKHFRVFARGELPLEEMRDLEMEDMNAALTYAASKLDRPVLVV